ncbi:SGNH/GDSL hydrolase family protein [Crossiella sp. CA198]|uniref:SGNH/GDSL hydrolase family protein n=1 Tax=Crossiella sp. CA198 TaxID=3455607 RepID=UPI003F8CF85C
MRWDSLVAIGDSFTEGMCDPAPGSRTCLPGPEATFRGWADRLAAAMAGIDPGMRYANLAVRGKLISEIHAEQVPAAIAAKPALVTVNGGGNDLLRPGGDPDLAAEGYERVVAELRRAGCDVLVFTGYDPHQGSLLRRIRGKIAVYTSHVHTIAARHDCLLVDLWAFRFTTDWRYWCPDRVHLSTEGHRRVALRTAEVLGLPVTEDWQAPLPPLPEPSKVVALGSDLRWAGTHLVPFVVRHLRGVSMGARVQPKRPELTELAELDSRPVRSRLGSGPA